MRRYGVRTHQSAKAIPRSALDSCQPKPEAITGKVRWPTRAAARQRISMQSYQCGPRSTSEPLIKQVFVPVPPPSIRAVRCYGRDRLGGSVMANTGVAGDGDCN
jgi:hypothetical protein